MSLLPHFRGIRPIIYSSIRDDLTKSEATRGFVSSRYVDCRCFRCNAGRWWASGADGVPRGAPLTWGPGGRRPAVLRASVRPRMSLSAYRTLSGKMRKRKVVPPEAAAAPEAAESSASEEEDSSVSDDFQP